MERLVRQRGQSLVEILFALALFVLGVVTIGYLLFYGYRSQGHNLDVTTARLLANEGLVAFSLIYADEDASLSSGIYGLDVTDGVVSLTEDAQSIGTFSRTLEIDEVSEGIWQVRSIVLWGNNESYAAFTYVSDHEETRGDAGSIQADIQGLSLSASSTVVDGILLENNGDEGVTVTHMMVEASPSVLLQSIAIEGSTVFEVSPEGAVETGVLIDTRDVVVSAATLVPLSLGFTESALGAHILITLTFEDGTERHIRFEL